MKFLCDVHLPKRLVKLLSDKGFSSVHGSEVLNGWNTRDTDFCKFADENHYVVISKDNDFRNFHILNNTPKKLIKINLGNISNDKLIQIFDENFEQMLKALNREIVLLEVDYNSIQLIER